MLAALLLFVVLWSDPFVRIFPPAIEGRDLNPMLQHPGLIFHPPLLYLGYGGLMVAASVVLASLLRGEFDAACARICWRWALPGLERINGGDHPRFPGGPIANWAGAAGGSGIRWKTPLYYPGFLPLRCCTVYP